MEKSKRNELLITLQDINILIEMLEHKVRYEKATDFINQLLKCYELKITILKSFDIM